MEAEEILSEGYPTEEALEAISHWTGSPQELVEQVLSPIFEAYGVVKIEHGVDEWRAPDRPIMKVFVATGGWSGCESAIEALEKSIFWLMWWESSHRGGLYYFHVPVEHWSTELGA